MLQHTKLIVISILSLLVTAWDVADLYLLEEGLSKTNRILCAFERETTPALALKIIASPWTKCLVGVWGLRPRC